MRRPNVVFLLVVALFVLGIEVLRTCSKSSDRRPPWDQRMIEGGRRWAQSKSVPERQDLTSFLSVMYERALLVNTKCTEGYSKVPHIAVSKYIVADKPQSILFCPIYKSASSSWLIALLQMRGYWGPSNDILELSEMRKRVYPPFTELDVKHQTEQFQTRFMIVRHPLERLLSCYRDKYENARKDYYYKAYGKRMISLYRERPPGMKPFEVHTLLSRVDTDPEKERALGNPFANPVGPTFTEFAQFVAGNNAVDEHWRPYHEHCAPCSIKYNFILKFEDLEDEGPKLFQHIHAPDDVRQRKENVFDGPPTLEVSCSYYSQLSLELLQQLLLKYEPDMQLFGYTADQYLKCADEYVKQ